MFRVDKTEEPKRKILLTYIGAESGVNGQLMLDLAKFLSERHDCRIVSIDLSSTSIYRKFWIILYTNVRHIRDIIWADTLMVHVFAWPSFLFLLLARVFRKKIVVFQWDIYPTTLNGQLFRKSLIRNFVIHFENILISCASLVVIPSEDFRNDISGKSIKTIPLWPQSSLPIQSLVQKKAFDGIINICFSGQINEIRALDQCVRYLNSVSTDKILLHIFSSDKLPESLSDFRSEKISILHHGHVDRSALIEEMRKMHFGLICLHPLLDQPGFPSKTFAYLAAGLPVVYFGRPLPGYLRDILDCKVGIDLNGKKQVDLKSELGELEKSFDQSRKVYLDRVQLSWLRISGIC